MKKYLDEIRDTRKSLFADDWRIVQPPDITSLKKTYQIVQTHSSNGIHIYDIKNGIQQIDKEALQFFAQQCTSESDMYGPLIQNCFTSSYVVSVTGQVQGESSVLLPFVSKRWCGMYHMFIILHPHARVSLRWSPQSAHISMLSCLLYPGAQLKLLHDDARCDASENYTYVRAFQKKDTQFSYQGWHTKKTYTHVAAHMQGAGAQANITHGATKQAVCWFKTMQDHQHADSKSSVIAKSVVRDAATVVHLGTIVIQKGAQKVVASQESKHMLVRDDARAYAVPTLEVAAHDVQCAHGVAIGRFEKDMLLYMQSRGLSGSSATELLEDAFLHDVVFKDV